MHQVTISLDSSGVSLHQRGYRVATSLAPINEVLAAGLLLLAGWDGQCDFLDPMCGSGTILIEAAMIAANIPANLHRKQFAFEKWADWDENLFNTIKESLLKKTKDITCRINGFDMDFQAIKKSKINISNAMLEDFIDVDTQDFFTSSKAKAEKLFILCNPPYDERLSIDTQSFYASIGNTLKKHYTNTEAWLITSNYDAIKSVGLKPSEKIKVFNGSLEARLLKYDIYEGSKRNKE
jgi:putative N6-adenine-specific DNA methylase